MLNTPYANPDPGRTSLAGQPVAPIRSLPVNSRGRDYFVGDLHGRFDLLEAALAARQFDPETDRLIATGDLIDRGAGSPFALDYLDHPWFVSVRGNHGQLLLEWLSFLLPERYAGGLFPASTLFLSEVHRHLQNGGLWTLHHILHADQATRRRWFDAFSSLPFALTVATDAGCIGVVHAETPTGARWDALDEVLMHRRAQAYTLQSRRRITALRGRRAPPASLLACPSIDRVVVGHSVVREPTRAGAFVYLDTGAGFSTGHLSVLTAAEVMALPDRASEHCFDRP